MQALSEGVTSIENEHTRACPYTSTHTNMHKHIIYCKESRKARKVKVLISLQVYNYVQYS